jgi:predicted Zn-dependent protease
MRHPISAFRGLARCLPAILALFLALAFSISSGLTGCTTNSITGRHQLDLIGRDSEIQMGVEAYKQALQEAPVSKDKALNDQVRRVGMRIAEATKESDYNWEFTVIDDPKTVNAWCLPGGKVAVYTGILKITQDDNGLATVLGHEISHAVAHHGAERMSTMTLLQGGATALSLALQNKDPSTVSNVMAAFGVGAQVGLILPFSRKQESEADHMGLIFMSKAGYDPHTAVDFWKRMVALGANSQKPPAFLSDHPADEKRVADLEKWMPDAEAEYQASQKQGPGTPAPSAPSQPSPPTTTSPPDGSTQPAAPGSAGQPIPFRRPSSTKR